VLSDAKRVPPDLLRLFVRLMLHYDLRKFRVLARVHQLCGADTLQIEALVKAGLLVVGPESEEGKPTYRVTPRLLLSQDERREWLRESEAQRQRSALAPLESFRE